MKLSFRGVNYESHLSTLETTEGKIGGTYRGYPWKTHRLKQTPHRKLPNELTYRGVTYKRG